MTRVDWSESEGHHLENLQRLLQIGLKVFRGTSPSKEQRLAQSWKTQLPNYKSFPFDLDALTAVIERYLAGDATSADVRTVLQRAVADLPELIPSTEIPACPPCGSWSFVVFDDDNHFVQALKRQLTQVLGSQFTLTHTRSIKQLRGAISSDTDIALLDLYAGTTFLGLEALATVKREDSTTPVFICTSDARQRTAWEMIQAGADGIIVKESRRDQGGGVPASDLEHALALACSRRSRVPFHRPSPVEVTDDYRALDVNAPDEAVRRLVSSLFADAEHVEIVRRLTGGKSDARVVLAQVDQHSSPLVLKVAQGERLLDERDRYLRYVRDDIANASGRVERPGALTFDHAQQSDRASWSAIAYTVAGAVGGGLPDTLLARFKSDPGEATAALEQLLTWVLPAWYRRSSSRQANPWLAFGAHCGPVVCIDSAEVAENHRGLDSWTDPERVSGTVDLLRGGTSFLLRAKRPKGLQVRVRLRDDPGLWLREGRFLAVKGVKSVDEERRSYLERLFDRLGTNMPEAFAIHGDLHLANVLVQEGRPEQPWLVDFAATGPGNPAWDLIRLEVDLALRVLSRFRHRWRTQDEWALDMLTGRAPSDLSWFGRCINAIRTCASNVYATVGLGRRMQEQYDILRVIQLDGRRKWEDPKEADTPFRAYLAAAEERVWRV